MTSPSGLPAKTWTHVATTYDGATMRLFVNGTQVASQPATGPLDASTSPLEIGGSLVDGGPFAGLIDDVRVYNTALTAAQIQTDMTTPIASARPASDGAGLCPTRPTAEPGVERDRPAGGHGGPGGARHGRTDATATAHRCGS